ncbi:rapamycin-insensitive companion of mTOR [Diabrotica virgifera virgifera]|uniref:Rapamycin-insensitive companion of mTOR n=1 Tax=Diabrotica virgifera virgifera TaxID=50390 RepID=A0ABM5JY62_DIAVI|nr:rapamycin-insensitive companion of mTOR [Diabrotica virgifera virgifera]
MAVSSWMLRQQNRYNRSTRHNKQEDVLAQLQSLGPQGSCTKLLEKICDLNVKEEILFSYLNAFVKLTLKCGDDFEYTIEQILTCLRLSLIHNSAQIRTAGLRCIRHVLKTETDIVQANKLLIPYLLTRSLDLILRNDVERIEAMKLIRKTLIISATTFDIALARCLVSLAYEGAEAKDRMLRVCMATLSELCVLNSKLFIASGGVTAISRNLLECQSPKIAESLCGVLLLLLDKPSTRNLAAVDLHCTAAPYCDFHYKHGSKDKNKRDERELRLNCARLSLLTILRSWPGILHFCSPTDRGGFRAIVEVLYLPQLEVRKSVLDLLYELLGLSQPEWSDELSVALSAVDPCEPQASWRLNEGFVVAEGRSILPHLAKTTPSTTDMHLALLLYCFLENGLLAALTEVIATSDTFICVRASILLGELLRLIQVLLPPGCCNISPSLPSLLEYATKSKPQAIAAITALQQLHMLMKRRPASYSLHLDYIIRNSVHKRNEHKHVKNVKYRHVSTIQRKIHQLVLRDGDDPIKETGVLLSNDAYTWDWSLINIVLKGENNSRIDLNDIAHRTFIKKLIEFYMPSKNKYSHMDLGTSRTSMVYTTAGIELINFLVELRDSDYNGLKPLNLIVDLFKDILSNIDSIMTSKSVHDCLFSPQHMVNTHCQSYFLFIGQFSRTEIGIKVLENINMFKELKELATTTNHDCYVKLIISSLEYIFPGPSRDILEAVITCNQESSRLYATQFLHVLLRAGNPLFSSWAIQLLVNQLYDKSRSIFLSALATLNEACELPECLQALIDINPDLGKLGEKGTLLFVRFLSMESGFNKVTKERASQEIKKWDDGFSCRYVKLVEGDIADALTLHQRNDDGKYDKRSSNQRNTNRKDVFLPPHLYGQLVQYVQGFELLISQGKTTQMIEIVKAAKCTTDEEILKLKAAIWTLGHMGTSNRGYDYLTNFGVVDLIVGFAKWSPVYSVRATAFYVLGLLATTPLGADDLNRKRWLCTRHDRHENWPVIREEAEDWFYGRNPSASTSEDVISFGSPFVKEFEMVPEDEDYPDERQDFLRSPSSPEGRRIRQSTLPTSKRPQIGFHKRSLSESKTFETNNGFYEDIRPHPVPFITTGRHRNSSMTESTTSGVSSCDSLLNKPGVGGTYVKTLSPIPSSSSLSTLQLPPQFKRVSHRISSTSTTNSDISTSSLTGSASNELSVQNLVGYNTLRLLRRMEGMNYDKINYDDYYSFNAASHPRPSSSLFDDFYLFNSSFTSVFSVPKFEIETSTSSHDDKRYMGICLPKFLMEIFPSQEEITRSPYIFQDPLRKNSNDEKVWQHSKKGCFLCSQADNQDKAIDFIKDPVKIEILQNIERLANPISNKYIKSHLIRLKQREPEAFRDICVYSEVCKICSENIYRSPTRRVLHELFLDVDFQRLYEPSQKVIKSNNISGRNSLQIEEDTASVESKSLSSGATSPTDVKTLDSLKLTFNENKFPIRNKK